MDHDICVCVMFGAVNAIQKLTAAFYSVNEYKICLSNHQYPYVTKVNNCE